MNAVEVESQIGQEVILDRRLRLTDWLVVCLFFSL